MKFCATALNPLDKTELVLIETRTPPHIKHKQEAVSPSPLPDPELPPLPIDWSYTPHLLEARWTTAVVSAVSAYRVSLSSPRPSATSPSNDVPVPHLPRETSASAPLRHRAPHFRSIALAFSLPVLTSTLAFLTYTETSKQFDGAVLFASFTLFRLLRQPTMFVPRTLSAIADARDALVRLSLVFCTPLREGAPFVVDPEHEAAGWVWEEKAKGKEKEGGEKEKQSEEEHAHEPDGQPPFALHDFTLSIPRSTLAVVVGHVGSGKTSLLQGLVDEMCTTDIAGGGKWVFGGSVVYHPQSAWIHNATLMDNVRFGQPPEKEGYWIWRIIKDSGLLMDLQLLADGDLMEMCVWIRSREVNDTSNSSFNSGEKEINLSGGQKQPVNIARALYYGTDVVIFDDPLSAVDANVSKALFRTGGGDYIYTLDGARIAEAGTYPELIAEAAGGEGTGENGDEDEAQVQVVSVEDALCVPLVWSY
ncbi:P-loop containing nucleoside triphosphate hydrolase protein [Mycena leptocephala]|nr:P-loop containing nucleoside triphosphate hydrolase protein [Mycena leptocephala]